MKLIHVKMANQVLVAVFIFSVVLVAFAQEEFQLNHQTQPQVVREINSNDGYGNYLFTYELDNGQIVSETGELRTFGDEQAVVKSGAYSFVSTDGQTYWVNWTADENGFHPIIGTGAGGIGSGQDAQIDPNALKSLVG